VGGLVGCGPAHQHESFPALELSIAEIQEGQRVVRLHCATCHGIGDNAQVTMLAPSLWSVRQHYIRKYPEPEAFVSAILAFLDQPQTETGLMPPAIEQYGLMAMLPLDEEQLRAAVRLICAGHVERPAWARAHDKDHEPCYNALAE
jgi:hypothetical protein